MVRQRRQVVLEEIVVADLGVAAGDGQIDGAVIVVVDEGHAMIAGVERAVVSQHLGELLAALVVPKAVMRRRLGGVLADVGHHRQVGITVVVVIAPGRADGVVFDIDAHLLGDVLEAALAVTLPQGVVAVVGDEDVQLAVAVEVADRAADAALGATYDGSLRAFSYIPGTANYTNTATSLPTTSLVGGGGTGASVNVYSNNTASINNTGANLFLSFSNQDPNTTPTATAIVNNLTGSGYTSVPTVSFSGGVSSAGTGPVASVRVNGLLTLDGGTLRTDAAITSNRVA